MVAIVIGTHGMFSEEILKSAEMIFGVQENVATVTFKPGEGVEMLVEKYKEALDKVDCKDGVLFMVDLFGGSPFNAASMIAIQNENMEIITGINLPMLLEVFGSKEFSTLDELVKLAMNSGKEAIKTLVKNNLSDDEDEL